MGLVVEDPRAVGVDPGRIARLDAVLDRYVDDGQLPGYGVVVARRGSVVHLSTGGRRDLEAGLPVEQDTVWRIYSMTKPITTVAAMMLYEEGGFELTDPVARWIPSFAQQRVWTGGSDVRPSTVPATEPVRVWHLMSHTAGLTYGFLRNHPVDAMLRAKGYEWGWPEGADLATAVDAWASVPLLFQPGTAWNYSYATDVLGRLVEVVSGRRLDEFLAQRVFGPLGMVDTAFHADPERLGRLARLYLATPPRTPGGPTGMRPGDDMGHTHTAPPSLLSGGGGLVSTLADYHRFTQMLAGGGELDGVRLLGPRTLAHMGRNHLPGGADLASVGTAIDAESPQRGTGFGLGFSVVLDPAQVGTLCSPGELAWGGAASTAFWVDPAEDLTFVLMTSLLPSSTLPLRSRLRRAVYQALVD